MPYLVALAFLAILSSLAAALFFMLRGGQGASAPDKSKRMARALAMRVGLSVLLFLCILVSWQLGWIHPTGIPPGR
jgi:formate hydrogenlyase subunit 3/multisubunit Na+/H+ antiporter MnhD subunit